MPLSKAHKSQTRENIVRAAGRLFRAHGYSAVSIDAVMAEAGLTRGGFYNHFKNKEALLRAVLREDHGLLRRLRADPAQQVMIDYLDPAHLPIIGHECSFANLMSEGGRHSAATREALQAAFDEVVVLLCAAAPGCTREDMVCLASASIGAIAVARNLPPEIARIVLLRTQQEAARLLPGG